MTKIFEMYKFPAVSPVRDEYIPKEKQEHDVVAPGCLVGIEVEVENIKNWPGGDDVHDQIEWQTLWNVTEDGSLRNNGREFISLPMKAQHIERSLRWLFKNIDPKRDFSPRTSVHVHINARTLDVTQLKLFTFIYMIFEGALFNFVGKDRDKNIHCVPVVGSNLLANWAVNPEYMGRQMQLNWMKYCAYNICPIIDGTRGTIEFRHMHGTDDVDKLMNWINIILCIKNYIENVPEKIIVEDILALNSTSGYVHYADSIFGALLNQLRTYPNFERDMEKGVTAVKTVIGVSKAIRKLISIARDAAIKDKPKATKSPTKKSYAQMVAEVQEMGTIVWDTPNQPGVVTTAGTGGQWFVQPTPVQPQALDINFDGEEF